MEDNNPTEGGTFEIFESAEAFQASMNQSEAPAQEAPAQEAAPVETQEAPVQETPYVDPEAAPPNLHKKRLNQHLNLRCNNRRPRLQRSRDRGCCDDFSEREARTRHHFL